MRSAWDPEAENRVNWARTPEHDHSFDLVVCSMALLSFDDLDERAVKPVSPSRAAP